MTRRTDAPAERARVRERIGAVLNLPGLPSTALLDDMQFAHYCEQVRAWAVESPRGITVCETESGHEEGCPMLGRAA